MLQTKNMILSNADATKLIYAIALGQGEATEEQITEFLDWAELAVINYQLIQLVLKGKMVVKKIEGSPEKEYSFCTQDWVEQMSIMEADGSLDLSAMLQEEETAENV